MDNPLGDAGIGVGGGIVGAILTLIGFKSRLDTQDKEIKDIRDKVRYIDTCEATHKSIDNSLKRIENKLDDTLERRHEPR